MRIAVFGLTVLLTLAGCGPKAKLPPPPIDLSSRLAEADALVEAGCFDCLRDALQRYQALRQVTGAAGGSLERALAGALRTSVLLALRQRELGMVDDGYLKGAQDLRTSWQCGAALPDCESLDRLLEVAGTLSFGTPGRRPPNDAEMAEAQRLNRNRQAVTTALRDGAGRDLLSAYVWLAFACAPGATVLRDDAVAALAALRDVPLVAYKLAICGFPQPDKLQPLLAADSRFNEVAYGLGLSAV